jgi:hypothetical protein
VRVVPGREATGWNLAEFEGVVSDPHGFGSWQGGQEIEPGVRQMPWFDLSEGAQAFLQAAYDHGWVRPSIHWMRWSETERGQALLARPDLIAGATEDEVAAVLTTLIRAERFGDGTLLGAVERGLLRAVVARLQDLAAGRTTLVVERLDGGPRLVIERSDLLAAWYFGNDAASVGPNSYDDHVGTTDPGRIVTADISAINRTMRARSPHQVWVDFTHTADPLLWLTDLPVDLSLFDIDAQAWGETWAARLQAPLDALIGKYRNLAVVTKVLHAKRPRLYPIMDSLVVQLLGASGATPIGLLDHIRRVGRMNEPTLRLIRHQLRDGEPTRRRTRVRVLDGVLWSAHPGNSVDFDPGSWERVVRPSPGLR